MTAPDGVTPGCFFTHYFNSSAVMREYVLERGVPASPGETTLEVHGKNLEATTYVDGVPVIRTRAKVTKRIGVVARGHLTYVTKLGRKLIAGNYAYIGDLVDTSCSQSNSSLRTIPSGRSGPRSRSSRSPAHAGSLRATPSSTRVAST